MEYRGNTPTDYVKYIEESTKDLVDYVLSNGCTKIRARDSISVKLSKNKKKVREYTVKYFNRRITIWGKNSQLFPSVI